MPFGLSWSWGLGRQIVGGIGVINGVLFQKLWKILAKPEKKSICHLTNKPQENKLPACKSISGCAIWKKRRQMTTIKSLIFGALGFLMAFSSYNCEKFLRILIGKDPLERPASLQSLRSLSKASFTWVDSRQLRVQCVISRYKSGNKKIGRRGGHWA